MNNMSVKHAQDVKAQLVKTGKKTSIRVLISSKEGSNFAMRRFVMQPGGNITEHANTVEHEQYVLKGRATIGIDGEAFKVHAGDVVFIPERPPHWDQNVGQEDFEFLSIIPNKPVEIRLITEES